MTEPVPRPSTPTVQQGSTPAVARDPDRGTVPTVQQGAVPTVQQGVAPQEDPGAPEFPGQLRDRFEPLRVLGTGTEGVVWCCRRTAECDEVAVKVHWAGHPADTNLLEHLDNSAFRRHVPRLYGHGSFYGPHGQICWAAMELLTATLDRTIADRFASGWSERWALGVLREVAQALHFWQTTVRRNPIDVKPDNLMRRANGEFVVVDFGGVVGFTASKQVGSATMAAVAYTPPEQQWHEKSWPWPWWTLGEIAYLLVTGHGRFQRPNGEMLSDQTIARGRALGELDLSEVADARWRLLITGLLTTDPQDRWGWAEVESWLGGGAPAVTARTTSPNAVPAHSPITFVDGRTFTDPAALAVAMLDNPHAAERWLTGEGRQDLADWLEEEGLHRRFDMVRLSRAAAGSARLHSAVLAFGAEFAPEVTPRYRGRPVSSDGLVAVLSDPDGFEFAGEVVLGDVLGTAAGYRCGHTGCGPRCAVLDHAAGVLPPLVQDVERIVSGTGTGALTSAERERLHGMALLLVLRPDAAARVLRPSWWLRIANVPWWRPIAKRFPDATTAEGRAMLLAQGILRERVVRERPRRDTTRFSARAVTKRVGAIAILWFAMTSAVWVVTVLRNAELAFDGGPEGERQAAELGATAQMGLGPQLVVLAIELVLLMRTKASVVAGMVLAAALGLAAPYLPLFTAGVSPGLVDDQVSSLAEVWAEGIVVGLVVMAGGSLGLAGLARSWLPGSVSRDGRARRPVFARRYAAYALTLMALALLFWAALVVRLTVHSADVATTDFGGYAASMQSGYLLAIAGVAAVVALSGRNAVGVLTIGVLAVLAIAAFAKPVPALDFLWLPYLREPLLWFAGLWGTSAFWAALLVHLPLTVLCVRGLRRAAGV
ncbi:hypothetical protein ACIRG5_02195 [Lentzea sp. NPDC102401]|uniref:protein kinase domain-containing protein n=1 Tax=Lentzea sp. NPDC102401 TaxID=3364128 RepID=UPI00381A723B